jgi:hypothetical protein
MAASKSPKLRKTTPALLSAFASPCAAAFAAWAAASASPTRSSPSSASARAQRPSVAGIDHEQLFRDSQRLGVAMQCLEQHGGDLEGRALLGAGREQRLQRMQRFFAAVEIVQHDREIPPRIRRPRIGLQRGAEGGLRLFEPAFVA